MRRFRGLVVGAGAVLGMGVAGCGNGPPVTSSTGTGGAACPGTAGVTVGTPAVKVDSTDQLMFVPTSSAAKVGQVVQWSNTGSVQHTVTFDTASCLTDASIVPGATWEVKFSKAGTYAYKCTIHPGMNGTLTVSG